MRRVLVFAAVAVSMGVPAVAGAHVAGGYVRKLHVVDEDD